MSTRGINDDEVPSERDWGITADVLDWLRMRVVDEPGGRDDVERVSALLDRVMRGE